MSLPPENNDEVSSSLSKMSIGSSKNETPKPKPTKKKAKNVVVDSWEDEDASESEPEPEPENSDVDEESAPKKSTTAAAAVTPLSPAGPTWPPSSNVTECRDTEPEKRPEKTDAVARRMIVAGLGLKAPKLTEEQKAYQRSVREQEKKKREQEKELEKKRKEEAEKAKASVWDD
ncbi:Fc.00g090980.m01.CDS01 [Cosmosporella sp. VM-42]